METIIIPLYIVCGVYVLVLLMIFADLWSGIRKARQRGELRTSTGYRRTVDKIARYYNALIALTITDAMQIVSIWYLDVYWDYSIPQFPVITVVGGIGVCLIEIRSILEKNDAKSKTEIQEAARLIAKLISKHSCKESVNAMNDYLTEIEKSEKQ